MDIFDVDRAPGSLEIFFSPKLRHIDRAGEETERFLEENAAGLSPFGVLLVMREALTNAVLYGSRHEEDSKIRYSLRLAYAHKIGRNAGRNSDDTDTDNHRDHGRLWLQARAWF